MLIMQYYLHGKYLFWTSYKQGLLKIQFNSLRGDIGA